MTEFNQKLRPGTWWGPVWGSPSWWTSPCSAPATGQSWWPDSVAAGTSPGTTDRTGWAAPSGGCGWSRLSVQHSWTPHVNLTWIWPDIKLCDTNPSIRSLNCSKLASEARNSSLSFSDWPGRYNHLTHWPLTYLQKNLHVCQLTAQSSHLWGCHGSCRTSGYKTWDPQCSRRRSWRPHQLRYYGQLN